MARYQLLRTSPSLSGQVRIDLILDKDPLIQEVTDIHISPINDNIDFNESNKRIVLRYSHLDNIKNLYRQIGSQFYSSDGEYSSNCWLYNEGIPYDPYSHTYMSGIKRMRYERYGKQFGFLMPLWISESTDMKKMSFRIHLGRLNSSGELIDNVIGSFRLNEKIAEYFNNYFNGSANGEGVSDNLLSIDFDNMEVSVNGIQANTGQYACIDASYILSSLLDREKPVIETNSTLIGVFNQNNMIAQQLLNLQFIFNIEDFSSVWTEMELYRWKMNIWIEALYDGEILPLKDLYTNSQFIPRYDISLGVLNAEDNCLDYMEDYKCLDYITINRFTQPILHWSLANAPRQVFNLYSGCAPKLKSISNSNDSLCLVGGNFNWIDISSNELSESKQNWKWASFHKFNNDNEFNTYITNVINTDNTEYLMDGTYYTEVFVKKNIINIGGNLFSKYKDNADKEQLERKYIDENKYSIIEILESSHISISINAFESANIDNYEVKYNNIQGLSCIDFRIMYNNLDLALVYNMSITDRYKLANAFAECVQNMISSSENLESDKKDIYQVIALAAFMTSYLIIPNWTTPDETGIELIEGLSNLYNRWIKPHKIEFSRSLYMYSNNESILNQLPEEISYTNNDNDNIYLYRYSGPIQPMFINPNISGNNYQSMKNYFYKYIQWNKNTDIDTIKRYSKLRMKNYPMQYPSIYVDHPDDRSEPSLYPYYPWIEDIDLYIDKKPDFYSEWYPDVFWMKDSEVWILPVKVIFELEEPSTVSKEDLERDIWGKFKETLTGRGLAGVLDEVGMKEYIYNLYNITQNFEYAAINDIDDIIYTVTFKLK